MSEFHDDYPQYEFMAHHSEEEGKKKRKKLWLVFWIMLAVTIVELIIGFQAAAWGLLNEDRTSSGTLKFIFIGLTVLKAFYIVFSFMHLGHEKKAFKYSVLAPYLVFILYLVYIIVGEANYSLIHKEKMDDLIVKQKLELNEAAKSGHGHEAGPAHEGDKHEGEKHDDAAKPAEEHH
ncbi:MAG: cytochrome C oxidase subunit IV family protein [Bacteroidota bacterium]|nr:cytochrome C oxidase subunit IV family protein [Bacteroidota bacterium]